MSSFQKRKATVQLPGTRQSLYNSQQLVSSGNPALDFIIGGGIQIGSILLIEEDKHGRYAECVSKYFCAESSVHQHGLFLATLNSDPSEVLTKLPAAVKVEINDGPENEAKKSNDEMRIAWRYNDLEKVDSEQGKNQSNYYFDMSQSIAPEKLSKLDVTTFSEDDTLKNSSTVDANGRFTNSIYPRLLNALKQKLNEEKFRPNTTGNKNLLRVSLQSFASPLWWHENFSDDLCLFLLLLKALIRNSLAVCCITIPTHLFKYFDSALIHRVRNMVDYSIELESFAGSDKEAFSAFKEYHGLLYIRKLAALNSLVAYQPETYDLAFKLRRKKFVIEKLHLPPELQESEQREQDDNENLLSAMSCGSSSKHLLEF